MSYAETVRRAVAAQTAEETASWLLARVAHPSRLEWLSAEVDRRAELVDQARTETPWTPSTAGHPMTSRTAAIYSVLDDLNAGRLW